MIGITGNEIRDLNDTDLRTLIGHLCEAELSSRGIPTAGVTFGGHQNAKDGGLDVRVEVITTLHEDGFIPRSKTGFQVKKPDMPRKKISEEMRPDGELRLVIQELADAGGAYIIVSSQGSTSDSVLTDRRNAMRDALSDYPNAPNIKVEFYDRERIAGWVRSFPAIVLWVREKIGRPIQGWKSYEKWAKFSSGMEEEYMLDEHIRLYNSTYKCTDGISALAGINELRKILQRSASSVRLVGLSGVGKTRLLQALFDERIGENPLNRSQVFYADVSDSLDPDPVNFAERLIALQKPCILAIDNCSPDLHRRLTVVCSATGNLVSLITIEYDVRDDQPEETEVFRLEPASAELIEKVIGFRFKHINEVSIRAIAKFSGGNARIAIALCNTVQGTEDLSNLRDEELFKRLFHQRNDNNSFLLRVAQACSLVYSFDGQTVEGSDGELSLLGSIIDMNALEIYGNVSELKRRELVQQRGIWKAVLPHALANKLAKMALENIPSSTICKIFERGGTERILQSFSRRLSYLHECSGAVEISRRWLSEHGLLRNINNLNEFGINVFKNIAPISPELTLSAIERVSEQDGAQIFFSRENHHYIHFTRLLQSLAYDKELFERAARLLCRFALSERSNENNNSIRDVFKSLFYRSLSGTHATPEQRLNIIRNLAESNVEAQIDVSISLLEAALESFHISSNNNFEFGSRLRDYGYSPRSLDEISQWYKLFVEYTAAIAASGLLIAPKAKKLLASKFRGLWINAGMYDELEAAGQKIMEHSGWSEGWLAVRAIKKFNSEEMSVEIITRLNCLNMLLKPATLIEQAKVVACSCYSDALEMVDTIGEHDEESTEEYLRVQSVIRSIGRDVGLDEEVLKALLPDILSNDGDGLFSFGQGLADGCENHEDVWKYFREALSSLDESKRNYQVPRGFLNAISEKNTSLSETLLNEATTDIVLAIAYPLLQTSVKIEVHGVERLKQSLKLGVAPIRTYINLGYGRAHASIEDNALCELLRLISSQPEGIVIAVDIFRMRLHGFTENAEISDSLISVGQELLLNHPFSREINKGHLDYNLAKIIKVCFAGESSKQNAGKLCSILIDAFENNDIYPWHCSNILESLAIVQPMMFLDAFLREDIANSRIYDVFASGVRSRPNPMTFINDNLIIAWCDVNPIIRYPIVAKVITHYQKSVEGNTLEWTSVALRLLLNSPNPLLILNEFKSVFRPNSWSGSLSETMQKRLCLISELKKHSNLSISGWACIEERELEEEIRSRRKNELKQESNLNERFE